MACRYCLDEDGIPCLPEYGLAPHIHIAIDNGPYETHFLSKANWPSNFIPEEGSETHGVWYCEHCRDGMPVERAAKALGEK